ncbi:MAG TPA: hypothetical protein DCM40_40110 [Maribacter sp.]|nr:hypothetical protein [Maribacter sp.]
MSLKKYIRNKKPTHFTFHGIEVFIKNPIQNGVSIKDVLNRIKDSIPSFLLRNVDSIYVGEFDFLLQRNVQAMYENSSIFVTNEQSSTEDMLDDLVHEIAHSVEDIYSFYLYSDQKIEDEFLQKRKKLWMLMDRIGMNVDLDDFLETEFSFEFDDFLYREVGYPVLANITANLFYSPYAATSLKEYFANGFENFFISQDIDRLKAISPILHKKILNLSLGYGDDNND